MSSEKHKTLDMQRRLLKRAERMAGIGHWHIDLNDNTLFWSDEIYRIYGLDKDEFSPTVTDSIEFFHPDDQKSVETYIAEAIEDKLEFFFELRLIRPNGDIRLVQSFGEPEMNEDGVVTGIFGIFRDITETRQKELKEEEQNKFLELVMESIPDPILVKDSDCRIIMANPAFLELYPEEKRDHVIGTTTVEDFDPQQAEEFLAKDKQALETGYSETFETIDFPNGTTKTLFTKKVRFQNVKKETNILVMGRDVSELQAMQNELERSNKDLQNFAATISHDLKAPLRHISMSANLIERSFQNSMDEEQKELLQIMTDGAETAQTMIDTLLEYSRIGQKHIEFDFVDLNTTINNVLIMLAPTIEEKMADVIVRQMPVLEKANEGLLMHMFQNLIENALKYHVPGQPPKILMYAIEHEHQVDIYLEDKGIGIDPEFADQIFIIFRRLHKEDSDYQGIGLGLAVCQKIARTHHGSIKLDTNYKEGARFIISLPLK